MGRRPTVGVGLPLLVGCTWKLEQIVNLRFAFGTVQVGKAGADSLFRDPAKKSTNVGVTVYPVTIASLEQFGDLTAVGQRLLGAGRHRGGAGAGHDSGMPLDMGCLQP